ncbi:KGK domain-containing protein [Microcoleus sp.]|uniref:KGK domain-containing protein n=1 Tax=Microcoleus sp. TaxID=44472 RepID=UPI0035250839
MKIECQILKIGSKGWQKGKVQIEVNFNLNSWEAQTSIKFCPDELPEQKSPLDDIRQSEEYKKLLENN